MWGVGAVARIRYNHDTAIRSSKHVASVSSPLETFWVFPPETRSPLGLGSSLTKARGNTSSHDREGEQSILGKRYQLWIPRG